MNNGSQKLSLGEAATCFLASLPAEEKGISRQEVYRFVRWYSGGRALVGLTAPEVSSYAEHLSLSDADYKKKLDLVKTFLVYAKKEGWVKTNLATHLKARKGRSRVKPSFQRGPTETISLTRQGYTEMEAELAALLSRRSEVIDEMRRAAADKDFRENAPLQAAREQRGHLEGQIKELEEALKSAVVIGEKEEVVLRVGVGDSFILSDLASGEELHYIMVSSREVDPTQGKISSASPIGRAVMGRGQGEIIEVIAPAGKLRYQIERIGC
ncbi:GreA/GreB family elongation factor [Chloroflexota bacterium]